MFAFRLLRLPVLSMLAVACATGGEIQPQPLSEFFLLERFDGGAGPWRWARDDIYEFGPDGTRRYIGTTVATGFTPYAIATIAGDLPNSELAISTDGRTVVFMNWPLHAPRENNLANGIYRHRYNGMPEWLPGNARSRVRWPKPLPSNILPINGVVQPGAYRAPASPQAGFTWALRADDSALFPIALIDAQPLHDAAYFGDIALCETLVAAGADIDALTYWGFSALELAIILGNDATAIRLMELGANPDVGFYPAFSRAVMLGRLDVVRRMLTGGADVNWQDEFGYSPLHLAIYQGRRLVKGVSEFFDGVVTPRSIIESDVTTELVRLLLESGADPTLQNRRGLKALDEATDTTPAEALALLTTAQIRSRE